MCPSSSGWLYCSLYTSVSNGFVPRNRPVPFKNPEDKIGETFNRSRCRCRCRRHRHRRLRHNLTGECHNHHQTSIWPSFMPAGVLWASQLLSNGLCSTWQTLSSLIGLMMFPWTVFRATLLITVTEVLPSRDLWFQDKLSLPHTSCPPECVLHRVRFHQTVVKKKMKNHLSYVISRQTLFRRAD